MSNEEELVKLCARKDREAQRILFEKYASKMMGISIRYTSNAEDAKDLLQDGFVRVFAKIETFNAKSSLYTWMSRIFVNMAINRLKRTTQHVHLDDQFDLASEIETEDVSSWGSLSREDILREVNALPDIYRMIINMYAVDGMTHAEIAQALEISEGSSKSRLSRARVLLKEQIKHKR